jgi:hypothetical protein
MTSWVELDERGKGRFAVAVVSITIVLLSIALRFWCKLSLKSGMYAEDWSILFVVPCYIAATTADLWGKSHFRSIGYARY